MKRAALVLLVAPFAALWLYGCDQASNPVEAESSQIAAPSPLFAVTKIDLCHLNGDGDYVPISISDNAYPAHAEHGDEVAGGGLLDANCQPKAVSGGAFNYQSIGNSIVVDDLRRVAWHPNGDFALLLGLNGAVVRYDASTRQLSAVATIGDEVSDLAAAQDGRYFVVVGTDGGVGHVWRIDAAGGTLSPAVDAATLPLGNPVAVEQEPGGTRFAIAAGTAGTPIANFLYLFDNAGGLSDPKAYISSAGVTDLMWGEPSLYGGEPNVVTSDGVSGADSWTWVPNPLNMVVANGFSGRGFGNPGGAAWRPGGTFGVLTGWTSNKLYVFDGSWTTGTLPLPTGASPNAIGWKADGTRALVVGRAIGSPLYASVVEYASSGASYSDTDLTDSSIPAFGAPPWNGNTTMYLQDVAWRPGTCDEGLIVGSDSGAASPTFGTVIRFFDSLDSECAP